MTEIPELKGKLRTGPLVLLWLLGIGLVAAVIAFLFSESFTRMRRSEVQIRTVIKLDTMSDPVRVQTRLPRRGAEDALSLAERFGGADAQKGGRVLFSPHVWCMQERGKEMACRDLRSLSPVQLAEIRERLLETSEPKLTEDQLPPALR